MCISGACFSCSLAQFFLFLVCFFFLFAWLYWLLIRWMTVCPASVYVSWRLLCFRVPWLSRAFYMAPVFFPVFLCFFSLYMYSAISWKRRWCLNRACYSSLSHVLESPFPRLWTYIALVILPVLRMSVHVCCRFLLFRLLFTSILCISIDIMALFQFHSTFCRCFYESVCR